MNTRTVVTIQLADVKELFFVRRGLSPDRVTHFVKLYEAGGEVPPLKVVRDTYELVDGRHRKAALETLGRTEAECILRAPAPLEELLIEALADNIGGALPPSQADINFVIRQLLEQSVPRAQIVDKICLITPLPRKFVIRHLDEVQTALKLMKVRQAARRVIDGATVTEAAQAEGVAVEALQTALGRKATADAVSFNRNQVMNTISSRFRGFASSNSHLYTKLFELLEAGEISAEELGGVLEKIGGGLNALEASFQNWVKRLQNLTPGMPLSAPRKHMKGPKRSRENPPTAKDALSKMGLGES